MSRHWVPRGISAGAPVLFLAVGVACTDEFETSLPPETTSTVTSTLGDTITVGQATILTLELHDGEGHALDSVEADWISGDDGIVELEPAPGSGSTQRRVVARSRGTVTVIARVTRPTYARREVHHPILVRERWIAVTAGGVHTCALAHDSTAFCWGAVGDFQQLRRFSGAGIGDGSEGQPVPVRVETGFRFGAIAAGFGHTCGFTVPAGLPLCWGDNASGQLGDGTQFKRWIPELVSGGITVERIAPGHEGTCAIRRISDTSGLASRLSCWGDTSIVGRNTGGQTPRCCHVVPRPPSPSEPGTSWQALAVGAFHTCALSAGTFLCWGGNSEGQLGDGTRGSKNFNEKMVVDGAEGAISMSAGGNHTCMVDPSGTAKCWGNNASGQLGVGHTGDTVIRPTPVVDLTDIVVISTAGSVDSTASVEMLAHTCAVTISRKVYCWGDNRWGQVDGTPTPGERVTTPREVTVLDVEGAPILFDSVSTAAYAHPEIAEPQVQKDVVAHTCALAVDGAIYCWGSNKFGQLGRDHTSDDDPAPARIAEPE